MCNRKARRSYLIMELLGGSGEGRGEWGVEEWGYVTFEA